jgi:hypothetical protein
VEDCVEKCVQHVSYVNLPNFAAAQTICFYSLLQSHCTRNGFSSLCVRSCVCKKNTAVTEGLVALIASLHTNDFSPLCVRLCVRNNTAVTEGLFALIAHERFRSTSTARALMCARMTAHTEGLVALHPVCTSCERQYPVSLRSAQWGYIAYKSRIRLFWTSFDLNFRTKSPHICMRITDVQTGWNEPLTIIRLPNRSSCTFQRSPRGR